MDKVDNLNKVYNINNIKVEIFGGGISFIKK
jgi:hypothetical protein